MGTQHSNKEEKENPINRMMEDKSNSTYLHVGCHAVCLGLRFPSATAETLHAGTFFFFFNRSRTLQRYISARFPSPVNFPILGWDDLKEVHTFHISHCISTSGALAIAPPRSHCSSANLQLVRRLSLRRDFRGRRCLVGSLQTRVPCHLDILNLDVSTYVMQRF